MAVHRLAAARRVRQPRRRAEPVTVIKVNAQAWQVAVELAEGDPRRLLIVDGATIIVRNNTRGLCQ